VLILARLLENQIKELLKEEGVAIPQFRVASSPEAAAAAAADIGYPVVLKALVPVGKRGKAGAVKFASTAEEVADISTNLLKMTVRNYPVEELLVEQKLAITKELYISITYDHSRQCPVVIGSLEGGIEIEEVSLEHPEKILTYAVDPLLGLAPFEARQIWAELGVEGKLIQRLGEATSQLYNLFVKYDAYLLEVNPLVVTSDDQVQIAAALMGVDDGAIYRQKKLSSMVQMGTERSWKPMTELEKKAVEVNELDPYRGTARYTEIDGGDIGFMCGGGGGSLLLFDALVQAGGRPANYSEFGGNPPEDKVYGLARVIMSKPGVKGLFVAQNITNNTQVDIVARGVIRAIKELGIDLGKFPVVVREAGVNEAEARRLFDEFGIEYHGDDITLTEAARRMVYRMREIEA